MTDSPRGVVTFLLTDIEGSTRLLRALGRERYARLIEDQRRLLMEAIREWRGNVVDTDGDGCFASFARASNGVAAAVAAQRALSAHQWPGDSQPRLRMGLHTGEATQEGDRYVGLAVHRVARICAASRGGQILVSQATASMLEDDDHSEALDLRDLGKRTLKDFDRPVRVYQVGAPGLQEKFPPARKRTRAAPPEGRPGRKLGRVLGAAAGLTLAGVALAAWLVLRGTDDGGAPLVAAANSVAIIDAATNELVASVPLGGPPSDIGFGPSGVWVAMGHEQTLVRLDPRTRTVVQTVGLGTIPTAVAVGREVVWVVSRGPSSVSRIDPQSGFFTKKPLHLFQPRVYPTAVAVEGPDVWIADSISSLYRLPGGDADAAQRLAVGTEPAAIATGPGAVWVGSSDGVARLDTTTLALITTPIGPTDEQTGLEIGGLASGRGVWATLPATKTLYRLDPAGNAVIDTIRVGAAPRGVAVGADSIWVANSGGETISRVDPGAGAVVATIRVGRRPLEVAFGEGMLWVTVL